MILKNKSTLIPFILSLLLLACNGNTNNEEEAISSNEPSKVESASCLADLVPNNEIEKMISAEQIAAIVQKPKESLEYSENKSKRANYSTFGYEWTSEEKRVMTMEIDAGQGRKITQEVPLDDQVDIGRLEILEPKNKTALEYFDFVYGPKTDAQKDESKKAIDKAKDQSDQVDEESAEALKSMVDKQKVKPKLEDVGDSAYWSEGNANGMIYVKLKVLHANTSFEIVSDVSDDTQEDLRVAKEIAQEIIANCN